MANFASIHGIEESAERCTFLIVFFNIGRRMAVFPRKAVRHKTKATLADSIRASLRSDHRRALFILPTRRQLRKERLTVRVSKRFVLSRPRWTWHRRC